MGSRGSPRTVRYHPPPLRERQLAVGLHPHHRQIARVARESANGAWARKGLFIDDDYTVYNPSIKLKKTADVQNPYEFIVFLTIC